MTDELIPPNEDTPAQPAPAAPSLAPSRDPWAHRRAEPRTFAFIWTTYLFLATVSTYAVTVTSGMGGYDVVRPAARMLLTLIAAGIVIVWPMVRFTQLPDPRALAGPILDLIVILVPLQAVIWPQHAWWLTNWPIQVVAAVAIVCAAWGLLVGAILSISHSLRLHARLSAAMGMGLVLGLLVVTHVPLIIAAAFSAGRPTSQVHASGLFSPFAGMYELTRDRTWAGVAAYVSPSHWRVIGLLWGVALALWLAAIGVRLRYRPAPSSGIHLGDTGRAGEARQITRP